MGHGKTEAALPRFRKNVVEGGRLEALELVGVEIERDTLGLFKGEAAERGFAEPPATLDHLVVPQVFDAQSSFWLQRKSAAQVRISTIIAESVHFRVDLNERSPHLVGS
jgi:hypothetical protein